MTLGLSDRMARVLLGRWVDDSWLEVVDQIPPGTGLCFIGNSSEVYRQWAGWVTATSVEADRIPQTQ